jgi:hypothetical protein
MPFNAGAMPLGDVPSMMFSSLPCGVKGNRQVLDETMIILILTDFDAVENQQEWTLSDQAQQSPIFDLS